MGDSGDDVYNKMSEDEISSSESDKEMEPDSDEELDISSSSESEVDEDMSIENDDPLDEVVKANEKFSNSLLTQIVGDSTGEKCGNIIISPMSLSTILALLKTGATGKSEMELATALKLTLNTDDIKEGYKELLAPFQELTKEITQKQLDFMVLFACRIFTDEKYKLKEDFQNSAQQNFYSEIEKLDFSSSVAAAAKINSWVSAATNKKIDNIVSAKNLDSLTSMVLVNALYLKGKWLQTFDSDNTKDEEFNVSKNESRIVKMMHLDEAWMLHTAEKELKASVLQLEYEFERENVLSEHCMLIYLPDPDSSVQNLVKLLDEVPVSEILANMEEAKVTLSMPKFKIEMTHNLVPLLKQLGVQSIFDDKAAELENIGESTTTNKLFVAEVIQKVYIVVDEEGTEAAAATVADMKMRGEKTPPPNSITFKVDRPFVFQIVDLDSCLILFTGVCSSPDFGK